MVGVRSSLKPDLAPKPTSDAPASRSLSQLLFDPRSCFQCESAACRNDDSACEAWAAAGESP